MIHIIADTENFCDMIHHILQVVDRQKYTDTDIKIPQQYQGEMRVRDAVKWVEGTLDFLSNADVSKILSALSPYYDTKKMDVQTKSLLSMGLVTAAEKEFRDKLKQGIVAFSVNVAVKLPNSTGRLTRKPVPIVVLDYEDYLLEVNFFRDAVRDVCMIAYRYIFPYRSMMFLLGKVFGKDAIQCMRKDASDKNVRSSEAAKQLSREGQKLLNSLRDVPPSRGLVVKAELSAYPEKRSTAFTLRIQFATSRRILEPLKFYVTRALTDAGLGFIPPGADEPSPPYPTPPKVDISLDSIAVTVTIRNSELANSETVFQNRLVTFYNDIVAFVAKYISHPLPK